MNISFYLLAGFLLALLLALRAHKSLQIVLSLYWLLIFSWSLGIVSPFTFEALKWSKELQLTFNYQIDGLSKLFSLLISGIGIVIFIFSSIYTSTDLGKKAKLLSLLQVFATSMLALVLVDNTLVLFVAWELTSVTSYLLIQFNVKDSKANQAAFTSLFITVLGSLAFLAGLILLNQQSKSWSIQESIELLKQSKSLTPAFWLLLIGAMTKSALFPFYFWLVGAMKAPAPVSAYLHSATMVNAGIYLLARFHPLLHLLKVWYPSLAIIGLTTMLLSGLLSLFQKDLKAILAYTTLFALGSMAYLLASNQWLAAEAFAVFLLFHALYKAAAFMWVGVLDKTYETRDLNELQGLGRRSYLGSLIAIISFAAMAGLPPFFGFVLKEMIYEVKLSSSSASFFSIFISLLSSMLIAAVSMKCLYYWFKGQPKLEIKKRLHLGFVPPLILVIIILPLEFLLPYLSPLLSQAADSVVPCLQKFTPIEEGSLGILLSFFTLVGGIVLLILSEWLKRFSFKWPCFLDPAFLFEKGFEKFLNFAKWFTHYTQGQPITTQLIFIFLTFIGWLFCAFYVSLNSLPSMLGAQTSWLVEGLSVLLILGGLSLLVTTSFLSNMVCLAILGLLMSAIFVFQGAPDVAMTQLLVEILTVVILVIALRRANFKHISMSLKQKIFHGLIAIFMGLIVTLLIFMSTSVSFDSSWSQFFIKNSLMKANGRNIVNVILVDFRAFDTLGEILVVLASTLAIYLLLDKTRSDQKINKRKS